MDADLGDAENAHQIEAIALDMMKSEPVCMICD